MSAILIVEDNERNLKLLRDILRAKGYVTLEARTAGEGLRLAFSEVPALILMDIQLPDFSGIEALRSVRANPRTSHIAVVAVSASAMPDDQERIMASGFDGYLTKPVSLHDLVATVVSFVGTPPERAP